MLRMADALGYADVLEAFEALPWHEAEAHWVTKIAPVGHESLSFFPGQRGFFGAQFPLGGIMLVANNFDNLDGWLAYESNLDDKDESATMLKFTELIQPETHEPMEQFWFTNYCLGVMKKRTRRYRFPHAAVEALQFRPFFHRCVEVMKPRLIVTLGAYAATWLGTDYAARERVDSKTFGKHTTRLMAIVHPSAWTWRRKGFTLDDFRMEGRRMREALTSLTY
jgi:uracil-DNA glycosylase